MRDSRICLHAIDQSQRTKQQQCIIIDIIRLVTKLFQQDWFSHHITVLLPACVVNHATLLLHIMALLEQPCNKSDNAIKLVTSSWQTCYNKLGTSSANTIVDNFYMCRWIDWSYLRHWSTSRVWALTLATLVISTMYWTSL